MANDEKSPAGTAHEPAEAVLVFREQADGRKVSRLPDGKVVLVDLAHLERVGDGTRWRVSLRHRETFAIATPLDPAPDAANPVLTPEAAARLRPLVPAVPATLPPTLERPDRPAEAVAPSGPPPPLALRPGAVLRPTDRVALFVDGANMDGACRQAGFFVDYGKVRDLFAGGGLFYAAYYYVAVSALNPAEPDEQASRQTKFLDFLSHVGYIVRRKPLKVIHDQETGERLIKGNLDIELALDMLNTVGNWDVAFLFTGDSDFERAVDLLRSQGRRVYVVTARGSLSRELAYVADKPIFLLEDLRADLQRDDRPAPLRRAEAEAY
jgi:uncharacterized LabA/DUF88 family protein